MCPDIFSGKTPCGSFPLSDYLPQVVAFCLGGRLRKVRLSFVVCKGQIVKRSKLRTRLYG